ncbi:MULTISPECIES: hypothetical protein, partial [unclassified Bradyrhizobium]|uniref:hypothetical protein n=1 Tax=unclassified Bradyrhizobium TaxID=2631580 RepID=UPI00291612A0
MTAGFQYLATVSLEKAQKDWRDAYNADRGYRVDLTEEEGLGHTIREHVNKSEYYLLDRVTDGGFYSQAYDIVPKRAGSFPSLAAANSLVNSDLPPKFHPAAVRVLLGCTPTGAGGA